MTLVPADNPAADSRVRPFLAAAGLVLLVFVAYIPAMQGGFIWDDDSYVTENPVLRTADGLRQIWLEPRSIPQYYPLVHTVFWVEYHLWGLDPRGYHVVNVALHALAAVLAWRLLRRLNVPGAYLAAAIFAVHPVCVESVAWVTELKNVLSLVFYLLAALAYLRFEPPEGPAARRWGWYAAALALLVLAVFSKTVVGLFSLAMLVILWWKRGRLTWRDAAPLAPLFVLGMSMGLVTAWLEKVHVGASGQEWDLSAVQRVLLAGRAVAFYAEKLAWPHPLIFNYPRWTIDPSAAWQWLYPAGVLAALAALFLLRRRLGRGPAAAALVFCGTLGPVLGFLNVYPFRYSFVADHFQYHACLAAIALAAAGATLAFRRLTAGRPGVALRLARAAAVGTLLAALAVLTWRQGYVYHDLESLWRHTLARNPASWMANNNLGNLYLRQREPGKAIPYFLDALRLWPDYAKAHNNLAAALYSQGRFAEALPHSRRAVELDPTLPRVHANLGNILAARGDLAEARIALERAVRDEPHRAENYYDLARTLQVQGRSAEAIPLLREAIRRRPDYSQAHGNLAAALADIGRVDDALDEYREAARLDPAAAMAPSNMAPLLVQKGRIDEAIAYAQQAIRLKPGMPAAHHNLGFCLLSAGDFDGAAAAYREALRLDGARADSALSLAWILAVHPRAAGRNGAEAVALAEAAVGRSRRDATTLNVLAAAYAEAGRTGDAVAAAGQAEALAAQAGDADLAAAVRGRLELYRAGRAYHEQGR